MSLVQRLEVRQGQALVMTPQLLQAIKLLQLSQLDLAAYVEAELERNPLLERAEPEPSATHETAEPAYGEDGSADGFEAGEPESWLPGELNPSRGEIESDFDTRLDNVFPDEVPVQAREVGGGDMLSLTPPPYGSTGGSFDAEAPDFEATLTAETSLRDHLAGQLELATRDPRERLIGGFLIDAVDEAGYLRESVEAVAERLGAEPAIVARILSLVQTFDPPGIAARDLANVWRSSCASATGSTRPCRRWFRASTSWPSAISAPCVASARWTTRISSTCWARSAASIPSPAAPSARTPRRF